MHRSRHRFSAFITLTAALVSACGASTEREELSLSELTQIASPAGPGSSEPNLTVSEQGRIYLTWQEQVDGAHELRFATLEGDRWSDARSIARGDDWFVNWADFPSLVVLPDGRLAAHYLRRNPTGERYHYDVEVRQSNDGGISWSEPVRPHRDGVPAEHGFVSLYPAGGGELGIVWLDGRQYHARYGGSEEMMLHQTTLAADGTLGPEVVIDDRICDCCQTSWAITSQGPVIAYRNRSPEEVRDIYLARNVDGAWSTAAVHADGWEIAACPVNGPAVAADQNRVAVAWFTAAQDTPRVRIAFSHDAGATFSPPVQIDSGDPIGRVDVMLLNGENALVSWLERVDGQAAEIRTRVVSRAGAEASNLVARSTQARASGFPRMVRSGNEVVFAWTEAGDPSNVRVARARLAEGR
ncbi:hypothetical protein BH23GEM6_BH23GEM6_01580 [soil metagenome]